MGVTETVPHLPAGVPAGLTPRDAGRMLKQIFDRLLHLRVILLVALELRPLQTQQFADGSVLFPRAYPA